MRISLLYTNRKAPHTARPSNTLESPSMLYALSWFFVLAVLALWSLVAWVLHAVAAWTVSNAGVLVDAASGAASGVSTTAVPDWLAPWVGPVLAQWASQAMASLAPAIDSLLQAAPALGGGLTVATWVIWGIGSVLLLLLGVGLHVLIALLRRRDGGASGPKPGPSLAAG
jgi:hypothetical protein